MTTTDEVEPCVLPPALHATADRPVAARAVTQAQQRAAQA
jgi:hypothetical protein